MLDVRSKHVREADCDQTYHRSIVGRNRACPDCGVIIKPGPFTEAEHTRFFGKSVIVPESSIPDTLTPEERRENERATKERNDLMAKRDDARRAAMRAVRALNAIEHPVSYSGVEKGTDPKKVAHARAEVDVKNIEAFEAETAFEDAHGYMRFVQKDAAERKKDPKFFEYAPRARAAGIKV